MIKKIYPVSRQGAGRVQVDLAAHSLVVASKPSLSFGEQNIESTKMLRDRISIKNISKNGEQEFQITFESPSKVKMNGPASLKIAAGSSQEMTLSFVLDASAMKDNVQEFDGWVKLMQGSVEAYRIPMLAVARKLFTAEGWLRVYSDSEAAAAGSAVDLQMKNAGANNGRLLLFNLISESPRKPDPSLILLKIVVVILNRQATD